MPASPTERGRWGWGGMAGAEAGAGGPAGASPVFAVPHRPAEGLRSGRALSLLVLVVLSVAVSGAPGGGPVRRGGASRAERGSRLRLGHPFPPPVAPTPSSRARRCGEAETSTSAARVGAAGR